MESLLALTGTAVVLFASTNIDDIFVLVGFFADPKSHPRDIVVGQYAGIMALFGLSLVASLLSLKIPRAYVGLLGVLPILIGGKRLFDLYRGRDRTQRSERHTISQRAACDGRGHGDNGQWRRQHRDLHPAVCSSLGLRDGRDCPGLPCHDCAVMLPRTGHHESSELGAPIRRYGKVLSPIV